MNLKYKILNKLDICKRLWSSCGAVGEYDYNRFELDYKFIISELNEKEITHLNKFLYFYINKTNKEY